MIKELGEGRTPEIVAISTKDLNLAARRSANSVISCKKIDDAFGFVVTHWNEKRHLQLPIILKNLTSRGNRKWS